MKRIRVLAPIALLLMAACSPQETLKLYASAASSGDAPASHASVHWSERVQCDPSAHQLLLNEIDADLAGSGELEITTDEWLDQHLSQFPCIQER